MRKMVVLMAYKKRDLVEAWLKSDFETIGLHRVLGSTLSKCIRLSTLRHMPCSSFIRKCQVNKIKLILMPVMW